MQKLLAYSSLFILLIMLQEFVLINISQSSYLAIYVYIMIVILADMNIAGWIMLLLGFGTGLFMDGIEGGGGLFTATTTWLAFVRPSIMQWTLGRDTTYKGGVPVIERVGGKKFFTYVSIMVLLWTVPFFGLEAIDNWTLLTPIRIVASSIIIIVLIYILQLPLNRKHGNVN